MNQRCETGLSALQGKTEKRLNLSLFLRPRFSLFDHLTVLTQTAKASVCSAPFFLPPPPPPCRPLLTFFFFFFYYRETTRMWLSSELEFLLSILVESFHTTVVF